MLRITECAYERLVLGSRYRGEHEGWSYGFTVEHDENCDPRSFDCYTPRQIKAWENEEWMFVGVMLSISLVEVKLYTASLWGIDWGDCPRTDEDDNIITEPDPNPYNVHRYIQTEVVPELFEEARHYAIAKIKEMGLVVASMIPPAGAEEDDVVKGRKRVMYRLQKGISRGSIQ